MQGVVSYQKLVKRFWENIPLDVTNVDSWVDRWSMNMVDWAIKTKKTLAAAQIVEVHRAWQLLKKQSFGDVTTIRIVAE